MARQSSKLSRYAPLIGTLILISVVFLAMRHNGISQQNLGMEIYETDVDVNEKVMHVMEAAKVEVRVPDVPKEPSKLEMISVLNIQCQDLIEEVRKIKATGVVMATDPMAQKYIKLLQSDLRTLLTMRFGEKPRILMEMIVGFPASMVDIGTTEPTGKIVFELADFDLVPYSVYNWLEITRRFHGGAFHRNAGHVLQAHVGFKPAEENDRFQGKSLAFQEYNELVPHKKLSLGYAGRPGGPSFYISTLDNSKSHGPGSQGSNSEADSCFAQIVSGEDVVDRMKHQPGGKPPTGFITNSEDFINVLQLRIISPRDAGAKLY